MALSSFPRAVDDLVSQLAAVANQARDIRDGTGDLRWSAVENFMLRMGSLRASYAAAKSEALKQVAAAQAYIADLGGPATLAEFDTLMAEVDTRIGAFGAAVDTFVAGRGADEFAQVVELNVSGQATKVLQRRDIMPAATATQLRGTAVLADLITALEALGA